MRIIDCQQGTPEWYAARCGRPTASSFDKILTSKGEPSKQRTKYLYQLAGETITGKPEESYSNGAMQRGQELEAEARNFYELVTGDTVQQVGFCLSDGYGCSPDGLVGEKGGLEIKCPSIAVHVSYLLDGKLPIEYFQQVQGNLLVTGREWWDFVSYYPGIKPLLIRVERDHGFINLLRKELETFCSELVELIEKIK